MLYSRKSDSSAMGNLFSTGSSTVVTPRTDLYAELEKTRVSAQEIYCLTYSLIITYRRVDFQSSFIADRAPASHRTAARTTSEGIQGLPTISV